jgi:uncharacterized Zn finger protein
MTIDLSTLTIYLFCESCYMTCKHLFVQDDNKYEVYRCEKCGKLVRYAVR